jgi:transposase
MENTFEKDNPKSSSKHSNLKPFWNQQSTEISNLLWLPAKAESADIQSSSFKPSPTTNGNSSFWITKLKAPGATTHTSSSSLSLAVDKWESSDSDFKTRLFKLYPTAFQRQMLDKWRHTNRYVFNKALAYVKKTKIYNFFTLRDTLVANTFKNEVGEQVPNPNIKEWEKETCTSTRAYAVQDVVTAFKAANTNYVNGNIKRYNIKFRKKKSPTSSFTIDKKLISYKDGKFYFYSNFMKQEQRKIEKKKRPTKNIIDVTGFKIGNRTRNDFKDNIVVEHDSKVIYIRGCYYLGIPFKEPGVEGKSTSKKKKQPASEDTNDQAPKKKRKMSKSKAENVKQDKLEECNVEIAKVIALDPGCRTFMTGYSTSEVIECHRDKGLFDRLRAKISALQEKKKYSTIQKYHDRMKNLVDEIHWKTIRYLTKNYSAILLPSFESQELVKKSKSSDLRRSLLELKHYQFKQRLRNKCGGGHKTRLYIVTEEYTSKTCGRCGELNQQLGSAKTFKCGSESCQLVIDRDYNGARNILLKHLEPAKLVL